MNNKTSFLILLLLMSFQAFAQSNLSNLVSQSAWDSLFPKRAGTYGTHPQGYTTDFYSYNNFNQAVDEMSDYFVVIRTKQGVWGQLITITRKSTLKTYNYSNVDNWWFSNSTPENIVIVDFKDFLNKNSSNNNKRELSAFLANISKETTGGWQFPVGGGSSGDYASWGLYFVHEVGYSRSNSAGTYSQSHAEYPPNANVGYYGRGPIQLSWNYNYGQFSKFIYNDKNVLLNYPDSILENGVLAFKSAIWFWMMPQCPKPSCHQVMHDEWNNDSSYSSQRMYSKGFAHTNNIINGGLECRTNSSNAFTQKVVLRSELYKYYLGIMGFNALQIRNEDSSGYSTLCYQSSTDAMENYANCKANNSTYGSFGTDSIVACNSFKWIDGKTYTKNTKTAHFKIQGGNNKGNDSLVMLNLTIKPNSKSVFSTNTCNNFKWRDGKTYTQSTDSAQFVISGGAANGCDSVITLDLKILPKSFSTDYQSACNSLTWIDGKTYTQSTDSAKFVISGGAANGCDSVITLDLKILPKSFSTDYQFACNSLTWIDGKTYTQSTDSAQFIISGGAANGCDSVITLDLKILPKSFSTDYQFACNSMTWIDGKTYTQSTDSAEFVISGGAANGCDSVITLDLKIQPKSFSTDHQTACNSLTWIDGKTYTQNTDSAQFVISGGAANGCDSVITLDLKLTTIDLQVSKVNSTLTAPFGGDQYQWLECNDGFKIISGETNPTFNATKNGKYAVIISKNKCTDTSACYEISSLNLYAFNFLENITIYPNPFNNSFQINYKDNQTTSYVITDLTGQTIQTNTINFGEHFISLEKYNAGIYLLFIDSKVIKLMKID